MFVLENWNWLEPLFHGHFVHLENIRTPASSCVFIIMFSVVNSCLYGYFTVILFIQKISGHLLALLCIYYHVQCGTFLLVWLFYFGIMENEEPIRFDAVSLTLSREKILYPLLAHCTRCENCSNRGFLIYKEADLVSVVQVNGRRWEVTVGQQVLMEERIGICLVGLGI